MATMSAMATGARTTTITDLATLKRNRIMISDTVVKRRFVPRTRIECARKGQLNHHTVFLAKIVILGRKEGANEKFDHAIVGTNNRGFWLHE